MDQSEAYIEAQSFVRAKETRLNVELDVVPQSLARIPTGWVFHYQSRSYLETRELSQMLVGQGPVVMLDDGRILEGGSVDVGADDVLRRHGTSA